MRPDPASPSPSDAQLLRQYVRERDDAAFGRVVGRHMRAVRHVAYRYTHHRQAAEDVAQAAFLVMAQRPRQAMRSAKWKRSALPWLAKVARYAAANWRRAEERRHRHETRAVPLETAHYDPVVGTAGVELAEAVRSALACLPRRDRRIVEWRHLSQMPWDEVARQAGTTPEAARKAGTRALSQLRTILERRGVTAGVGVIGATLSALSQPAAALPAPLAIELARKVILMARIKTASALTAIVTTMFIGGALVSNATGGQDNGLRTAQQGQPAATPGGGATQQPAQVRKLMNDHLAVLRQIVAVEEQQYGQGRGGMLQVYEARRALAHAEYEYAESLEQRIAALQAQVEIADEAEKHAAGLVELGRGDSIDALKWKAAALEAKVALEQSKAK